MPTRYLKPGIRDSERLEAVSPLAECLFYRLLVTVDDFGRYDARPAMLKSACFPVRESMTAAHCAELLDELAAADLVALYSVDGKPCLQLQRWDSQPRAKVSKYPGPEDDRAQMHATACKPRTVLPETETETANRNRKPKPVTETGVAPGPSTRRPAAASPASATAPTADLWASYADAYRVRYGVDPVRNATVNAQLAAIVGRLGREDAPHVARFYLSHNGAFYVRTSHQVGAMLKDCEALRTQWATRRQVTSTSAAQADKTQTNLDAFAPLLAEARAQAQQQTEPDHHHAE